MKINRIILSKDKGMKNKVYDYFNGKCKASKKEVDYLLSKHNRYNTLIYKKSKYICIFNINGSSAYVNHLISNKCGVPGIRSIAAEIKKRYHWVEQLVYEREFKKNSKLREIKINRFIK